MALALRDTAGLRPHQPSLYRVLQPPSFCPRRWHRAHGRNAERGALAGECRRGDHVPIGFERDGSMAIRAKHAHVCRLQPRQHLLRWMTEPVAPAATDETDGWTRRIDERH